MTRDDAGSPGTDAGPSQVSRADLARFNSAAWSDWLRVEMRVWIAARRGDRRTPWLFAPFFVADDEPDPGARLAEEILGCTLRTTVVERVVCLELARWTTTLDGVDGALLLIRLAACLNARGLASALSVFIKRVEAWDVRQGRTIAEAALDAAILRATPAQLKSLGRLLRQKGFMAPLLEARLAAVLVDDLEKAPRKLLSAMPRTAEGAMLFSDSMCEHFAATLLRRYAASPILRTVAEPQAADTADQRRIREGLAGALFRLGVPAPATAKPDPKRTSPDPESMLEGAERNWRQAYDQQNRNDFPENEVLVPASEFLRRLSALNTQRNIFAVKMPRQSTDQSENSDAR